MKQTTGVYIQTKRLFRSARPYNVFIMCIIDGLSTENTYWSGEFYCWQSIAPNFIAQRWDCIKQKAKLYLSRRSQSSFYYKQLGYQIAALISIIINTKNERIIIQIDVLTKVRIGIKKSAVSFCCSALSRFSLIVLATNILLIKQKFIKA